MPNTKWYHSREDARAMPADGRRYEVVHAELLVTSAVSKLHELVLKRLLGELREYVGWTYLNSVLDGSTAVSLGVDSLVVPDICVADLSHCDASITEADVRSLLLVVEITDSATSRSDRFVKRRLYQEQGIPHYWMIDPERRVAEIWTPDASFPAIERERLVWRHPALETDCVVELGKLFGMS